MGYDIQQNFISALPKLSYRNGIGNYEGVVCHATDNYNDTAINERNYESGNYDNAFVHFFVDDTTIVQVADTNYLCWGCGHEGNQRFVQVELCQSYDQTKFNNAYARYVWLLAKILHDKGLGVIDGKTLVSHKWVSDNLGGTTHQDPISYLASHGVSWEQHVSNVQRQYDEICNNHSPFIQVVRVTAVTDIRADHSHTSGFIKNAIVGEVYNVIERFEDWHRVILDDKGNSGWIDGNNGLNLYWIR